MGSACVPVATPRTLPGGSSLACSAATVKPAGQVEIPGALGDAGVRRDGASERNDEPPGRLRDLAEQPQPVDVGREQADDDPPGRRFDEPLERDLDPLLAPRAPRHVDVGRVRQEQPHALLAQLAEALGVEELAVGRRSSNLKSPV